MKRSKMIIGATLSVLLALALVTACDTGSNKETPPEDPTPPTDPTPPADLSKVLSEGVLADWSIAKGYENATALPLAIAADSGTMKVTWSSSMDFRSCELYAMLPATMADNTTAADYGAFDGIQFDVKLPASSNFLLLLRNPSGGTTMKIWEDYVYRGTDDAAATVWVTVKKPFDKATDTGWGPAAVPADLKGWLTADKAVQKQINLNPVLNVGGGSAVDTDIVMYIDNIGFYKTGPKGDGSDDAATIVWDFEAAI